MNFPETLENRKIQVGGKLVPPLGLKSFFLLEYYKKLFIQSITNRNMDKFILFADKIFNLYDFEKPDNLFDYLVIILDIISENTIKTNLAFLRPDLNSNKTNKKNSWEHEYDSFTRWIHLLCKTYHWDLKTIENLDPNLAAYLIQEILVDEQINKEWEYSLTEFAYKYDSATKKSTYQPLPRPYWMQEEIKPIEKVKIRKELLPYGVVVISGIETPNAVEYKETI